MMIDGNHHMLGTRAAPAGAPSSSPSFCGHQTQAAADGAAPTIANGALEAPAALDKLRLLLIPCAFTLLMPSMTVNPLRSFKEFS